MTTITEIKDKENIAFKALNESVITQMAEVVSKKKIKLNYDYTTTWSIFVGLTFLALFVALLLKREDRIKGYGLELPHIEKEEEAPEIY